MILDSIEKSLLLYIFLNQPNGTWNSDIQKTKKERTWIYKLFLKWNGNFLKWTHKAKIEPNIKKNELKKNSINLKMQIFIIKVNKKNGNDQFNSLYPFWALYIYIKKKHSN